MSEKYVLNLATNFSAEELMERLQRYEPWGHRIDFSNGVTTSYLKRRIPYSENTLQKIITAEKVIPFEELRDKPVLDIGCNSGYNSIYLAQKYSMQPTGIDTNSRHIEVSNFLSEIAGIEGSYVLGDAENYCRKNHFSVVLHFGTLYHLPNPLLSLKTTYENLALGGYLALETQVYEHPDDHNICYFMHMHNNDKTNFWALSPHVLKLYLDMLGFGEIQVLLKVSPKILEKYMSRILLIAQKLK